MSLAFVTANTSVVNFTVRSLRTSGDAVALSLLVGGTVQNAAASIGGDGVDFALPGHGGPHPCLSAPDFQSGGLRILGYNRSNWTVLVGKHGEFSARDAGASLLPGSAVSTFLAISMGLPGSCDAAARHVASTGAAAALAATRARWQRYLNAVLPRSADDPEDDPQLLKNVRWSAVKALMTLVSNWRIVPGHGQGILPSFVKYDTAFWSWDSYKQAVATVLFHPDLARDQLRLIIQARNSSSGHITDDVNRCGVGGGAPGKPNLLSWAVMEIYTKTNDTAFLAEMYPVIEAFHHFQYTTHDTMGVGMLSWQRGPESGMDNGVRFMHGARNVHNPQPAAQGGHDAQRDYTFDFWSVDLNSYLYREKVVLTQMAAVLGNATGAAYWQAAAETQRPRLQDMFYVPGPAGTSFFQDRYFNGSSVQVQGCEGFTALFCGVASQAQADAVAKTLSNPDLFMLNFSLPSVSKGNPYFNATDYWEGPTWLDQTWFASEGLKHYGYPELAAELKSRLFLRGRGMWHGDTTPLHEYYDPMTGSPHGSAHFSWSAAHVLMWAAEGAAATAIAPTPTRGVKSGKSVSVGDNGAVWRDTSGNQIEAHGGNILLIGDVYHWYGSTKKETVDPATGKPCRFDCSLGINVYTSTDLLSWAFGGVVFNSTQINVTAIAPPLAYTPPFRIERPKVIFNAAKRRYVLVFHCEDAPYSVGLRGVASSADPTGPFRWEGASQPNGLFSMDMTEYVDPNDPGGAAYHVRTARFDPAKPLPQGHPDNTQWLVGTQLTPDYLGTAPAICFNTSTSTEGPALLYHAPSAAYFIFGSHLTGLRPNPGRLLRCNATVLSQCCTAPGAPTKWEDLGNFAVGSALTPEGDGVRTTFNSQSTFVLPLSASTANAGGGSGAPIALWMGDRWHPDSAVAPGGEHNATYCWFGVYENSNASAAAIPPLFFEWQQQFLGVGPRNYLR